jgi:hypothetical protein
MLALALAAMASITLDHATVAGSNLKSMQAALEATGIVVQYGGPHANGATEMSLASFPDGSYLELIAVRPGADPKAVEAHTWARFLKEAAVPCAWAAQVSDLSAEAARLRKAGVKVSEPVRSGRARPDGVRLEWETVQVGDAQGAFFPFLIHDFTPRRNRAFLSGKPANRDFGGIEQVVIAVADLDEALKRYRAAYDLPLPLKQVDRDFGAHLAVLGGTPVVLAAPLTPDSWIAGRIAKFGEGPCAFVLSGRRTGRYRAAFQTRWFGVDVSWFDPARLGWRLGWK